MDAKRQVEEDLAAARDALRVIERQPLDALGREHARQSAIHELQSTEREWYLHIGFPMDV